ncbi:MAG: helix-turn-helix transcriptional regulator, partial [Paracoccaceae bacterium]
MSDSENGFGNTDVTRALQMVASWTAALQGCGDLGAAADLLMAIIPARYVRLDRHAVDTGAISRIYASADAPGRVNTPVLQPSSRDCGSIIVNEADNKVTIALGSAGSLQDTCEIGLQGPMSIARVELLKLIARELAHAWARRQPGLISKRIAEQMRRHGPRNAPSATSPILDYSNPYGLSRCEFRVCAMIGQGMTAKAIAQALNLSEATVRSHQRAIYAKTELGGQIGVMLHLKSNP